MQATNPGIHHIRIGDVLVTALNDGQFEAGSGVIVGLPAEQADTMLRETFRPLPARITVSAFLLRMPGRTVLVDTGCGTAFGPTMGGFGPRLASLGVKPESVETILITHAHVDHVSGLVTAKGAAAYPNADLYINEAETAFWMDASAMAKAPEGMKDSFQTARRCLGPYGNRLHTVRDGAEPVPGVSLRHLPGHTPGHSGWMVTSGGDSLFIWADVVHLPGIQFARPEAGMAYDFDAADARATRARVFDMVATDRVRVAGIHLDFPTFGHVTRAGTGYAFIPEVWTPTA
jgi:glyoxylase-like metal-dependent hydrolase (beta-lactamase superfamily II)